MEQLLTQHMTIDHIEMKDTPNLTIMAIPLSETWYLFVQRTISSDPSTSKIVAVIAINTETKLIVNLQFLFKNKAISLIPKNKPGDNDCNGFDKCCNDSDTYQINLMDETLFVLNTVYSNETFNISVQIINLLDADPELKIIKQDYVLPRSPKTYSTTHKILIIPTLSPFMLLGCDISNILYNINMKTLILNKIDDNVAIHNAIIIPNTKIIFYPKRDIEEIIFYNLESQSIIHKYSGKFNKFTNPHDKLFYYTIRTPDRLSLLTMPYRLREKTGNELEFSAKLSSDIINVRAINKWITYEGAIPYTPHAFVPSIDTLFKIIQEAISFKSTNITATHKICGTCLELKINVNVSYWVFDLSYVLMKTDQVDILEKKVDYLLEHLQF